MVNSSDNRSRMGCIGCGELFGDKFKQVHKHMEQCCPEKLSLDNLQKRCILHGKYSEVPGYSPKINKDKEMKSKSRPHLNISNGHNNQPLCVTMKTPKVLCNRKWTEYDGVLRGENHTERGQFNLNLEKLISAEEPLRKLLDEKFDEMPDPYGIQNAMGTKKDWLDWGLTLAVYPMRTAELIDQYQNDIQLHLHILDDEKFYLEDGYCGSFVYIRALHCIFQDAFFRCYLPFPPRLNLIKAIELRDCYEPKSKSRLRSFRGYKLRAFEIVRTVIKNPLENIPLFTTELPEIIPAGERQGDPMYYERDKFDDDSDYSEFGYESYGDYYCTLKDVNGKLSSGYNRQSFFNYRNNHFMDGLSNLYLNVEKEGSTDSGVFFEHELSNKLISVPIVGAQLDFLRLGGTWWRDILTKFEYLEGQEKITFTCGYVDECMRSIPTMPEQTHIAIDEVTCKLFDFFHVLDMAGFCDINYMLTHSVFPPMKKLLESLQRDVVSLDARDFLCHELVDFHFFQLVRNDFVVEAIEYRLGGLKIREFDSYGRWRMIID